MVDTGSRPDRALRLFRAAIEGASLLSRDVCHGVEWGLSSTDQQRIPRP